MQRNILRFYKYGYRRGLDGRLFHSILKKLKTLGIPLECALSVTCSNEMECLIKSLKKCKNLEVTQVAIDPGQTVGVAVLVDTVLVWSWEGSEEEARSMLPSLLSTVMPDRVVTSIEGVDLLPHTDFNIILVDEHGTSKKRVRGLGRHVSSAFVMATRNSISRRVRRKNGVGRGGVRPRQRT